MLYIKWLTESSNFSYDQGGIPILKDQEYPETLSAFDGIELILNADQTHGQRCVEAAINGDETMDDIVADWNEAWNAAVDENAPAA